MERSNTLLAVRLSALRRLPATSWALAFGWILLFGTYAIASLTVKHGPRLTAFGDVGMCLVALFASLALLLNVTSQNRRIRAFWLLLAAGCACWFVGQLIWTYFEVVLRQEVPNPFVGDVIIFLHPVPMIAALALKPHDQRDDLGAHIGYLDFSLLLVWWVFLYAYTVIPWQYVAPNLVAYGASYDNLAAAENLLLVVGFATLLAKSRGAWREIYSHLFSAALLYAAGSYITNRAIDVQHYYTGSPSDLPLIASFVWFGTAGIVGFRLKPKQQEIPVRTESESRWSSRFVMVAVFSVPLMAVWSLWLSKNSDSVRTFRIGLTQLTLVVVAALLFIRQRLIDHDRLRLLAASRQAFRDLQHFQSQMIQNEKLMSIGQLAAGAAHEINNPLTGILGYSDLLVDDPALGDRQRVVANKIRTLARRIKTLVTSLLSFARRVPSEKELLNLNQVIETALHLSNMDLRGKKIAIEILADSGLPPVRGDANQLLQVCFNLISNAVDAIEEVGGGKITIRTSHDLQKVLIEFSDSGPGIRSPQQVFDPFFTTKPVGKGTGLGLSICYGIVQEHAGRISCWNRPEGGATFLVELPVLVDELAAPEHEPSVSVGSSAS
jgi:signal transduction histidine kinase